VQGSLFITWGYLGIKRRKSGFICWSNLENKQKSLSAHLWAPGAVAIVVPCAGAHGVGVGAPEAVPYDIFVPFSYRSSVWKLWGTWDEFSSLCIVFSNLLRTNGLQFHILDPSLDVLICRFTWFLFTKHLKHLWSRMIYDKTELQWLKWKQYNMFLKPLTTHLSLILFVFKYKKNILKNIIKVSYDTLSSCTKNKHLAKKKLMCIAIS